MEEEIKESGRRNKGKWKKKKELERNMKEKEADKRAGKGNFSLWPKIVDFSLFKIEIIHWRIFLDFCALLRASWRAIWKIAIFPPNRGLIMLFKCLSSIECQWPLRSLWGKCQIILTVEEFDFFWQVCISVSMLEKSRYSPVLPAAKHSFLSSQLSQVTL